MGYGTRIKEYFSDRDITQKDLAQSLDLSPPTLNNYLNERTNIPTDLIVQIAQMYHVSIEYFLGLTDDPKPPLALSSQERELIERSRTLSREHRELLCGIAALMQQQDHR